MNHRFPLLLPFFMLAMAILSVGMPRTALAADPVICEASIDAVDFSTFDPTSTTNDDISSTLHWSCTNQTTTKYYATVCFNIGNGPLGLDAGKRQLQGPGGNLDFQIYTKANRSNANIWGAIGNTTNPNPVRVDTNQIKRYATVSGTIPVYLRLFGNQGSVSPGLYASTFSSPDVRISGSLSSSYAGGDCGTAGEDAGNFSSVTFQVTVLPVCTVTATDLNFGNAGLLAGSNHDGTSSISVTCVSDTQYKIGLDNGLHANGTTRRMLGSGGQLVRYELYSNNGRTTRWGNTPTVDTVDKTGNGNAQTATVYGRVPAQSTPASGTYTDTITVTVTY